MEWGNIIIATLGAGSAIIGSMLLMRSELRKAQSQDRAAAMNYDVARAKDLAERERMLYAEIRDSQRSVQEQISILKVENNELRISMQSLQAQLTKEKEVVQQLRERMQELEEENRKLRARLGTGEFRK